MTNIVSKCFCFNAYILGTSSSFDFEIQHNHVNEQQFKYFILLRPRNVHGTACNNKVRATTACKSATHCSRLPESIENEDSLYWSKFPVPCTIHLFSSYITQEEFR